MAKPKRGAIKGGANANTPIMWTNPDILTEVKHEGGGRRVRAWEWVNCIIKKEFRNGKIGPKHKHK
jgi:hypothetical protein